MTVHNGIGQYPRNSFAKDRVQAILKIVFDMVMDCAAMEPSTRLRRIKQILAASESQAGRKRETLSMSGAHRSIIA